MKRIFYFGVILFLAVLLNVNSSNNTAYETKIRYENYTLAPAGGTVVADEFASVKNYVVVEFESDKRDLMENLVDYYKELYDFSYDFSQGMNYFYLYDNDSDNISLLENLEQDENIVSITVIEEVLMMSFDLCGPDGCDPLPDTSEYIPEFSQEAYYSNYDPSKENLTGSNIKVGLFDTGYVNLASNPMVVYNWSTLQKEYNQYKLTRSILPEKLQEYEHAGLTSTIIKNIAPDSSIYYFNFDRSNYGTFEGFEWLVESGVDVINASMVYYEMCNTNVSEISTHERFMIRFTDTYDIPIVAATGNNLIDSYKDGALCLPGSSPNTISVGSIGISSNPDVPPLQPSVFSNYRVSDYLHNTPTISSVGENYVIDAPSILHMPFIINGTSFSAPTVTGAVALLLEDNNNYTSTEITSLLTASAYASQIDESYQYITQYLYGDRRWPASTPPLYIHNEYDSNHGFYQRVGAGILDIDKLLEFTDGTLNNINISNLRDLGCLIKDSEITISLAWKVSDEYYYINGISSIGQYEIEIYDSIKKVAYTNFEENSNQRVLRFTVPTTGYYSFRIVSKTEEQFEGTVFFIVD